MQLTCIDWNETNGSKLLAEFFLTFSSLGIRCYNCIGGPECLDPFNKSAPGIEIDTCNQTVSCLKVKGTAGTSEGKTTAVFAWAFQASRFLARSIFSTGTILSMKYFFQQQQKKMLYSRNRELRNVKHNTV